jgi:hypothetical protein
LELVFRGLGHITSVFPKVVNSVYEAKMLPRRSGFPVLLLLNLGAEDLTGTLMTTAGPNGLIDFCALRLSANIAINDFSCFLGEMRFRILSSSLPLQ